MPVETRLQTTAVDGFVSTQNTEQVHFQGLLKFFVPRSFDRQFKHKGTLSSCVWTLLNIPMAV